VFRFLVFALAVAGKGSCLMFGRSFTMRHSWYLLGGPVGLSSMFAPITTRSSAAGGGQALQQQAEPWQVCSLSDRQQQAAPKTFEAMMPTFKDPRCINCHGVVNTLTDTAWSARLPMLENRSSLPSLR